MMDRTRVLVCVAVVVAAALCMVVMGRGRAPPSHGVPAEAYAQCAAASSCAARDDVNDPAYNMRGVIMQTILLEEHLADENKYCKPCIAKHFLHILALLHEAMWMACGNRARFPLMEDSLPMYEDAMRDWLRSDDKREACLEILARLRKQRQMLIEAYVLSK